MVLNNNFIVIAILLAKGMPAPDCGQHFKTYLSELLIEQFTNIGYQNNFLKLLLEALNKLK